ncbi:endonuclease domain-containing protein [Nocardia sp. NPDC059177]|uniref:endonuclease domain-containing protein n=1 Tax=Nocardia sp. NPDC059177 TaxID=3346759 RepID=UPI0036B66401
MVTRHELRHDFDRVAPDVYARKGLRLDAVSRAKAAVHWTKGEGVLVGRSAAALLGSAYVDADQPAAIALPRHRRTTPGITVIQAEFSRGERCEVDGYPVTTPPRTAFDLARLLPRDHAVPLIDALCRATGLHPSTALSLADGHQGIRGCARARAVLGLADPGAESPPESLTRLLLIDHGLPTPTTQIVVRYPGGEFLARLDMGWEKWRVAVEYDGAQHWTDTAQRTKDIDRHAVLAEHGWRIVRVGADLLRNRPYIIIDRVLAALTATGAHLDSVRAA